jgi:multidrug resistance efflux pump
MNRNRIFSVVAILAVAGLGLTALMAAREVGDKSADPPAKATTAGKSLVCMAYIDTDDRVVGIFPDNFPMSSRVTEVLVKEGDIVTAKQKLLKLDTELLDLKVKEAVEAIAAANEEVEKAAAMIRAHDNTLKVLEKEILSSEATLEAKREELDQAQRAFKAGSINAVQLKLPEAAFKAAELTLSAIRLKHDLAKLESPTYLLRLAEVGKRRAEILKSEAQHARDQMACKAPADGKIIRSFVSEGSTFTIQSREPAFWFLKQGPLSPLIVRAEVTQEFARRVVKGQTAIVKDESDSKQEWRGKVVKVGDHFLSKRQGNTGLLDFMPTSDDRVLECIISLEQVAEMPRFGQKVRVTLGE